MPATKHYPDLAAAEKFRLQIAAYPGYHEKEADMKKMYAADRRDFRRVLSLYKKGLWSEAAEVAGHMDTAPRDYIPERIWSDIQSV